MQITPKGVHYLDTDRLHRHKLNTQTSSYHHGYYSKSLLSSSDFKSPSLLLGLPSETLTHITAFLDPQSLLALGRTNKHLHEHIKDDNTWRSAFLCQFLGELPGHPDSQECPLLRRTESSWRKEFIQRRNLLWRWERARNGMITHQPFLPPVASIHVLSERSHGPALLSTALQYGLVARSLPLTGKVFKRYITPSDGNGFGLGNPNVNANFLREVTASSVTSEGWTARIVWGFANGEVTLTIASRIMEDMKMSCKHLTCRIEEQHNGRVVDIIWDGDMFVTASIDGEVRIWNAKHMRCVLVLKGKNDLVKDPIKNVVSDLKHGFVLATTASGSTLIWNQIIIPENANESDLQQLYPSKTICSPHTDEKHNSISDKIFLDPVSDSKRLLFGIHFAGDSHFYGVEVDLVTLTHKFTRFRDGPLGVITCFCLHTSPNEGGGRSVVFAGDILGRVSVFIWHFPSELEVSSFARVDDHNLQSVASIACNEYILTVGTDRGVTHVYDALSLAPLRIFTSPKLRTGTGDASVRSLYLERDMFIVSVGDKVMAWVAETVQPHKLSTSTKKGTRARNAKWHKRVELAQDVKESRQAAAEVAKSGQRSHQRQRDQLTALNGLGLSEHEALEYVLMLSRDEEEQRRVQSEEGVFNMEFDDIPNTDTSTSEIRTPRTSLSRPCAPRLAGTPSQSNGKVQVTPPFRPEPMEAGFSSSPVGLGLAQRASEVANVSFELESDEHFPVIGSSGSNTTSSSFEARITPPVIARSWSDRVKSLSPNHGLETSQSSSSQQLATSHPTTTSASPSDRYESPEDIDEDLKLALELSLAEALSLQN